MNKNLIMFNKITIKFFGFCLKVIVKFSQICKGKKIFFYNWYFKKEKKKIVCYMSSRQDILTS